MAIAEGSATYFAYKLESTPNTEESGAGGTVLRRVTGTLNLVKQEVTSAEKRDDFQEVNVNHGTRSVDWSIAGELFGGDYSPFFAALMRRNFSGVSAVTADLTISSGVLSRAAGSFIADGIRAGQIVRLSGMDAANNDRNLRVTSVDSATALSVEAVDGGDPVADNSQATGATLSVPGQVTFVPSTGHTSDTFTIERHNRGPDTSDIARGNKVGTWELSVQPDQPPSVTFSGMGIDRRTVDGADAPVLTSPAASGVGPALSAGIGFVRAGDNVVGVVTGLTMSMDLGVQNRAVAFGNTSPDIFYGRVAQVTGTLNVLRENTVLTRLFDDETEVSLEFFIEAPGTDPKEFVSIYLPRVKLNSADDDDPDGPIVQTFNFRALKPTSGTGVELSTIMMQDSGVA